MEKLIGQWQNLVNSLSKAYVCGHCGSSLTSEKGYHSNEWRIRIYLCHFCNRPTFFDHEENQIPGPLFGSRVNDIPSKNVEILYDETRKCIGISAYTASVLCSRKLLMNIAVSKGAKENLHFIEYVEFLAANHFIPPDGKEWVDHIRKKGNEATHEIAIMKKEDAEDLIKFIEMLLKFIFEFPAAIKKKVTPP